MIRCSFRLLLRSVSAFLFGSSFVGIVSVQQAHGQSKVQIAALRLSKGQEIEVAASTPVLLIDEMGQDVSKQVLGSNPKCETDRDGLLNLTIPKGKHCFVVLNEFAENSASESNPLIIPSLTLISDVGGNIKKSVVSRNLDCIEIDDAIAELSRMYELIETNEASNEIRHFRDSLKSTINDLKHRHDTLEPLPNTTAERVTINFSAHLVGRGANLLNLTDLPEALNLSDMKWAILDAWGGIIAQGSDEKKGFENGKIVIASKRGSSSVRLLPGRLYVIVVATNRSASDAVMPPTYTWFCPSSGKPVTTLAKSVEFDRNVAVYFPSLESTQGDRRQIESHLQRMNWIIKKAVLNAENSSDIIKIHEQILELLQMIRGGQMFADVRDVPNTLDVLVHLVKDSPQVDDQWERLRRTALNAKATKFWAICDTTNKDAFEQYFAQERNGRNLGRIQILGYLPVIRNNGINNVTFSEEQLIREGQVWRNYGVRGVFIDFYDAGMTRLTQFLRQSGMTVFAHVREPLYDESSYNTPFVDAFIISNGTLGPAYSQIRSLTKRQLLPQNDSQSISKHLRFGALERDTTTPEQRVSAFVQMTDSRCSVISMGMPDLVNRANGNQVFLDQKILINFWSDFVTHTEQHNIKVKSAQNRLRSLLR